MKKNIIIVLLVLIIICLAGVLIYKNNKYTYIKDLDMYKNISDINEIVIRYNGLVVEPIGPIELSEQKDIKEVFETLGNIKVYGPVNLQVTDSDMVIIIYTNESVIEFNFQSDYFVMQDGNHSTKDFDKLEEVLKKYI